MRFVVEAGNAIVGLWFEVGADDAAFGIGREKRQASARDEIANEGRYENGLAGAG